MSQNLLSLPDHSDLLAERARLQAENNRNLTAGVLFLAFASGYTAVGLVCFVKELNKLRNR